MRFAPLALLVLLALLMGCGETSHEISVEEVDGPYVWGALDGVQRVRHLWFAGQPDEAALEAAKRDGISVVIDLRAPGEREWEEAAVAEQLGLTYYNVPVPGDEPFSAETFDEIEALVKSHRGEQTLIHCSSGNRAAAWLTVHLVGAHGMELEPALEVGRRAGITKEPIAEKTRTLLR